MRREEILALLAGQPLPASLKTYLAAALRRGRGFSFTSELKRDPEGFLGACGRLLASASRALGRPAEELLFATGFGPANMAPHRLEAALAELAAALFLHWRGFSCVELIGPGPGRTADLSAVKDGLRWAFEVRCLSAEGELDAKLLAGKYLDKLPQAGAALKRRGFDRAAVVLVRDPLASGRFKADPSLEALAAGSLAAGKRKTAVQLCLLDRGRFGLTPAG